MKITIREVKDQWNNNPTDDCWVDKAYLDVESADEALTIMIELMQKEVCGFAW